MPLHRLPREERFHDLVRAFPRQFSFTQGPLLKLIQRPEPGFSLQGHELAYGPDGLWRGLGTLMTGKRRHAAAPLFSFRGLMLDASRNAVPRPIYIEGLLPKLALLGFNALSLYTEDTLELEGHPLVGIRRGRYSAAEIRRLSEQAAKYGITLFPSIQTLGHLEQVLKFGAYRAAGENEAVLDVGSALGKKLVLAMLKACAKAYGGPEINVGLDEAWGLGKGKGKDAGDLFVRQVNFVAKACAKLGLKPVIWSDMISGASGEKPLSSAQLKRLPKGLRINYWDYYREREGEYASRIRHFQKLGFEPRVSPGLQNWNRMWANYPKTAKALPPMMRAAKRAGLKQAVLTSWGNDGQEAPFGSALPGLCLFAAHAYEGGGDVGAWVKALGRAPLEAYAAAASMEFFDGRSRYSRANLSKCLLWDDPLLRVYASQSKRRWTTKFQKAVRALDKYKREPLFQYAHSLAQALALKADLGNLAAEACRKKRRGAARALDARFAKAAAALKKLSQAHARLWDGENKAFGFEVIEGRYAMLIARLGSARRKLRSFARGGEAPEEFLEADPPVFMNYPYIQPFYRQFHTLTVQR